MVNNVKRQLNIVDLQNALNIYTWYNLPKGLTGNIIEKILYYKGQEHAASLIKYYSKGSGNQ